MRVLVAFFANTGNTRFVASEIARRSGAELEEIRDARPHAGACEGLRYIRSEPKLYVPLVMMALIGTFAFNFSVTMPLLIEGPLGGGTSSFTTLFSIVSLGSLLGALATARRASVDGHHVVVGATGFGLSLAALAVAPNLAAAFVVAPVLGVTSILFLTSSTATVQLLADPVYRGRVLAIQAIKEQQAIIDAQEARITKLEALVQELIAKEN